MRGRSLAQQLFDEVTIYGGLPMRRADVMVLATEHMGASAGPPFGADWLAFGCPAVDLPPWSLEEARKVMAS